MTTLTDVTATTDRITRVEDNAIESQDPIFGHAFARHVIYSRESFRIDGCRYIRQKSGGNWLRECYHRYNVELPTYFNYYPMKKETTTLLEKHYTDLVAHEQKIVDALVLFAACELSQEVADILRVVAAFLISTI